MKMWTTAMIAELGDTHRSPRIKRAVEMVSYTPVGERCQVLIDAQPVDLHRSLIYSGGDDDSMVWSLSPAAALAWA